MKKIFGYAGCLTICFCQCELKDSLEFKGGTSLSKAFGIIDRFSEDIDLILDWRVLNLNHEDFWKERSNSKRDKFVKQVNKDTVEYLQNILKPKLESDIANLLNKHFSLHVLEREQTIAFAYPRIFEEASVLQEIRLEIGVLGAWAPSTIANITPYVAEDYPHLFTVSTTQVRTVETVRTFWEKITILHKEAFRENGMPPMRYSRHYYDVYQLIKAGILDAALSKIGLLKDVVDFKSTFYYSKNAHYEDAKCGSIKLLPPESSLKSLREDYAHMKNMIFGTYPSFDEILITLEEAEHEINSSH